MTLPDYRFYSADLLTGTVLADLPLYGVYCQRLLSSAGSFTGTYKLGTGKVNDSDVINGTLPGRTAIYVERNGTLIWGGIIWSRTYATQSKTMEMTGQTFESIWDHVVINQDFVQQQIAQETIFQNLVNLIQAQPSMNFGLSMATFPTTGVLRTELIPGYEYHFASDVINDLVGVDNGLEYTIDVAPSGTTDHPTKTIKAGWPHYGNQTVTDPMVFDFPGNIDDYYWPESANSGGVDFAALGYGSGINAFVARATDGDALAAGYPDWWVVNSYKDIADLTWLSDAAKADQKKFSMPATSPTFTMKSDQALGFTGWNNIGDAMKVHIEDERFPTGFDAVTRMLGWELTTADSDSVEEIKFTIDGASV